MVPLCSLHTEVVPSREILSNNKEEQKEGGPDPVAGSFQGPALSHTGQEGTNGGTISTTLSHRQETLPVPADHDHEPTLYLKGLRGEMLGYTEEDQLWVRNLLVCKLSSLPGPNACFWKTRGTAGAVCHQWAF